AVLLVLAVAIANVGNLSLARVLTRTQEFAVRRSIGCGDGRLIRQLFAEHVFIGLLAAVFGLTMALGLTRHFADNLTGFFPTLRNMNITGMEGGYIVLLIIAVSLILGCLSLFAIRKINAYDALRAQRSSAGRHSARVNHIMLTAQTAFSLLLVVMAGLLVKSFWQLSVVNPGFNTENILTLRIETPPEIYAEQNSLPERYHADVLQEIRKLLGVDAAGNASRLPLTPGNTGVHFRSPDFVPTEEKPALSTNVRIVSEDYFKTIGMRVIEGRSFEESDVFDGRPVAVINEAMLRQLPEKDVLGKQFTWVEGEPWVTVVGVVSDVKQHQLDIASRPETYLFYRQGIWGPAMSLVVKSTLPADTLAPSVSAAVKRVNPNTLIMRVAPFSDVVARSLNFKRFVATLFSSFAVITLLLAVSGVYALTAQNIARRKFEFGICLAVGATPARLIKNAFLRGIRPVLIGMAAGAVAGIFASRLIEHLLFEVAPFDAQIFLSAAGVFAATAAIAILLPSLRIPRLDPQSLLTQD
ncbi:MAG: FtsX-like permease family protein, partial [Gammaproteobacteria bacterium]|nr:FtsX-like permease family protein [Gammaproteobacteria bacterium]